MNFAFTTRTRIIILLGCLLIVLGLFVFFNEYQNSFEQSKVLKNRLVSEIKPSVIAPNNSNLVKLSPPSKNEIFYYKLASAASSITDRNIIYDNKYFQIKYPGGDIPKNKGVCSDVVIRSYRKLGIDLQAEVHKDMRNHFSLYPNKFGLSKPDTNIDHRRVANLMVFFKRKGKELPVSKNINDYSPGDLVVYDFGNGLLHIAIVSAYHLQNSKNLLIVHNAGYGQVMEDALLKWRIIGHYRYLG